MKRTINVLTSIAAILLATSCISNAVSIVEINNVVVAGQTEAQRRSYLGRGGEYGGEIVRNIDRNGLTMFDGSHTGGYMFAESGELSYYVRSGTNAVDNFETLSNIVAIAYDTWQDRGGFANNGGGRPTITVEAGEYDFGSEYLEIAFPCAFKSSFPTGGGAGFEDAFVNGTYGTSYLAPAQSVVFTGTSCLFSNTANTAWAFFGITFDGPFNGSPTQSYYDNCIFLENLPSHDYGLAVYGYFQSCTLLGTFMWEGLTANADYFGADNCFFGLGCTNSFRTQSGRDFLITDSCFLGAKNFDQSRGLVLQNCYINGAGLSLTTSFTSRKFINCDFGTYSSPYEWTKGGMASSSFYYCRNVATNAVDVGFDVMYCIDREGNAMSNP